MKINFRIYWPVFIFLLFFVFWCYWPKINKVMLGQHQQELLDLRGKDSALAYEELRMQWEAQRGDSYGSLNVLLAALAFMGVLISINLQLEALEHEKEQNRNAENRAEEDRKSADELARSDREVQKQIASSAKQTALLNALATKIQVLNNEIDQNNRMQKEFGRSNSMNQQRGEIKTLTDELNKILKENGITISS